MQDEQFTPAETLEIHDLDRLKVMADPMRMQIVDTLRRGSATVKEIAAGLDVSPKSLYYHVNLLERHGLIRVVGTRLVSGIVEKRYRATAYLFNYVDLVGSPDASQGQSTLEMVSSLHAITRDEIRVSIENGLIDLDECAPAGKGLQGFWNLLELSPQSAEELSERLEALVEEFASRSEVEPAAKPYRILVQLFPTYRRGERPQRPGGSE